MNSTPFAESADSSVPYEEPTVTLIGSAADVVLGPPGLGYDGPCGWSEPEFEFEADEE